MSYSDQDPPIDPDVLNVLLDFADKFEVAGGGGHELATAGIADGLARILKRFAPRTLTRVIAESPGLRDRRDFAQMRPDAIVLPDPVHLAKTHSALTQFREALKKESPDVIAATRALIMGDLIVANDSPAREIEKLELELAKSGGLQQLLYLTKLAKSALWLGDQIKAELYAIESLSLEESHASLSEGEATHDGNMVLGLIALRSGNVEKSKVHLRSSISSMVPLRIRMSGPNLSLAYELIKRNEREAVADYFGRCRGFWKLGRETVDSWIVQIDRGQNPSINPYFLTL